MGDDSEKVEITIPESYAAINVEFTQEESDAIDEYFELMSSVADERAGNEVDLYAPQKAIYAMQAQALLQYADDCADKFLSEIPHDHQLADRALKAQTKAYALHNLPIYIFRLAAILDLVGKTPQAKSFFGHFLRAQEEFTADRIDESFWSKWQLTYLPSAIRIARERIS
jgi:tetratricopeptide (TPR) repeat protein